MWTVIFVAIAIYATWHSAKSTYEQEVWEAKNSSFINTIWKLINKGLIEKEKGEEIIRAFKKSLDSYEAFEQYHKRVEERPNETEQEQEYQPWELQDSDDETVEPYKEKESPSEYIKEESKYEPQYEPEKPLTEEEIKERNINWILNSGVILILLAGILFATTNWQILGNIAKAVLFTMVGVLFFGVSIITEKVLKIHKTSFAFWILGSLFLPLSFLGYAYFGVFGEYFSIMGQGKFILGVIGSLVCLPVYIYSAYKYQNRIFVWVSLINITACAIFLVSSFNPARDVFYFLLIAYNAILLLLNIKLKKHEKLKIFTDETNIFVQINLVLTTAVTLFSYDNKFLNSINVLICAGLYMFAILTINIKDYTYLFNILFSYGMYSIISSSMIHTADTTLYALVGIIFIGFAELFKKDGKMKTSFLITSGIIATIVFGGMAYQLAADFASVQFSWLNLISYIIIAADYLYLAIKSESIAISAFFPISLLLIALEIYKMLNTYFGFNHLADFMFGACFVLFIALYAVNNIKALKNIRNCSVVIYIVGMLVLCMGQFMYNINVSATVMAALFTLVLYILYRKLDNAEIYEVVRALIPSTLFISIFSMYYSLHLTINFAVYLAICSLIIFWLNSIQFVMKNNLSKVYFITGHILLLVSALDFYLEGANGLWFFIILLPTYIYSYIIYPKEYSKVFLYLAFISLTAMFDNLFKLIGQNNPALSYAVLGRYTLLCSAVCVVLYYFVTKNENIKKHIAYYLTPVSVLIYLQTGHSDLFSYWALLAFYVTLICIYRDSKLHEAFNIVPLALLVMNNIWAFAEIFKPMEALIIAIIQIILLLIVGTLDKEYKFNYDRVDVFSIFALIQIMFIPHFPLYQYVSLSSAICVAIYYFATNSEDVKKNIACYITPLAAVTLWQGFSFETLPGYFALTLLFAVLIYMYYRSEFNYAFNIIPLTLLLLNNIWAFGNLFSPNEALALAIVQTIILLIIGTQNRYSNFSYEYIDLFSVFGLLQIIFMPHFPLYQYVSLGSAIGVVIFYFATNSEDIKKHLAYYLTPVAVIAFFQVGSSGILNYFALLAFFSILIYMYYRSNLNYIFKIVPLILILLNNIWAYQNLFDPIQILFIALIQIAILIVAGCKEKEYLFNDGEIDLFNIFALINIVLLPYLDLQNSILSDLVKPVLLSSWLFIQIPRQSEDNEKNMAKTVFTLSILWPYYSLIFNLDILYNVAIFIYSLPIIIVTYIITRHIYNEYSELKFFEYASQVIVYSYILGECFYKVEIGIFFGLILIVGIIIANSLRWKSLFIGTNAMLLINVFIQTREFWFSIHWWIYLLVGGLALIIIASMNEFGKIKGDTINKIKEKFDDWN